MEEQRAQLIERIKRTDTVESFRFRLPKPIPFLPGQFLEVIFDERNRDNKELNKYLSLSSSPTQEYREVTKKLSGSQFSKRLADLRVNDEVLVKMPMGNCVFRDEYGRIGFLIGGIGITPVIAVIEYIVDTKLGTDVYLFYSNRADNDIAFKKELDCWSSAHKNIKVYYTVTDCRPTDKTCSFGFISKDLLLRNVCDVSRRTWFIYGSPHMVNAMCNLSLELQCKRENLKTEEFTGY